MVGLSGTFAINGTNFLLPPTESGWVGRNDFGIDGGGHPIYPAMREFEISWGLAHPTDVKQIIDAYKIGYDEGLQIITKYENVEDYYTSTYE